MKLTVIGFGRCGGQVADAFARLNKRARRQRGVDIVVDAFAVNSGETDLAGIRDIKSDYNHRILLGSTKTRGHSAAKLSELGAQGPAETGKNIRLVVMLDDRDISQGEATLTHMTTTGLWSNHSTTSGYAPWTFK